MRLYKDQALTWQKVPDPPFPLVLSFMTLGLKKKSIRGPVVFQNFYVSHTRSEWAPRLITEPAHIDLMSRIYTVALSKLFCDFGVAQSFLVMSTDTYRFVLCIYPTSE